MSLWQNRIVTATTRIEDISYNCTLKSHVILELLYFISFRVMENTKQGFMCWNFVWQCKFKVTVNDFSLHVPYISKVSTINYNESFVLPLVGLDVWNLDRIGWCRYRINQEVHNGTVAGDPETKPVALTILSTFTSKLISAAQKIWSTKALLADIEFALSSD